MLSREHMDRIHVAFDDHCQVANAGPLSPVTLAWRLGLGELVDKHVDPGGFRPIADRGRVGQPPERLDQETRR